ncbi:MAG: AMP-binding protein [Candidatus Limnocylindrales bacterium]
MIHDEPARIAAYRAAGWWGDRTIDDLFAAAVTSRPDDTALVDPANRADFGMGPAGRLSWHALDELVERYATGLLGLGIGHDDLVMVQLPNVIELVATYLACARIGAILSPLPVQYRAHELRYVLELAEPKAFIASNRFEGFDHLALIGELRPAAPSLGVVIADTAPGAALPAGTVSLAALLDIAADPGLLAANRAAHAISADDVFTVCWTSGTEADPKGVPRSHNLWISIAYATVDGAGLEPGDALLCPFPLVNMSGIGGMLVPWLLVEGRLVLHQPMALPVFLGQVVAERIAYTVAPPVLLNLLLLRPQLLDGVDLSSIRRIGSGSAPLTRWMTTTWKERHGIDVLNFFGSNEGIAMVAAPPEVEDAGERAELFPRYGTAGLHWLNRSDQGYRTRLVNPATEAELTEPGMAGEMRIQGPTVFGGYFRRRDLTEKSFDAAGFFRTGDLFSIETAADGQPSRYRFVGRLKDLIIRGGMNIAPEEIELLLADHPKLAEVAVVGYMDGGSLGEEQVCVVAVARPEMEPTLHDVVEHLKAKEIAAYKLPKRLLVVPALPRNPVGKVLKRELRAQLAASHGRSAIAG